jgi:hypothetical protein
MKRLILELDDDKHLEFKVRASKAGISMRKILTELIDKWLYGTEKNKK